MTLPLVNYTIADGELEGPRAQMYDYVFGGNGVFIRARNRFLEAMAPVAACTIRGLEDLEPYCRLDCPRVPEAITQELLELSARAYVNRVGDVGEALFYLIFDEEAGQWGLDVPPQLASTTSVRPANPDDPGYARALIEVHSHHGMSSHFSGTDDADEVGFRLFGVLGELRRRPTLTAALRLRVGVFGHFQELPVGSFFELPDSIRSATWS